MMVWDEFIDVLEEAKNLKSEYIIIPRNITQRIPSETVMGVSYDAIIMCSEFEEFKSFWHAELWKYDHIPYIALATKDINVFFQNHRAKAEGSVGPCQFEYVSYNLGNSSSLGIATKLIEPFEDNTNVEMPLVNPYKYLGLVNNMMYGVQNSTYVYELTELENDEQFRDIIDSKAKEGGRIWIPKIPDKQNEYAMTLSGTIFNVSKGDKVSCVIRDNINKKTGYHFIAQFTVWKPKKKCVLVYYLMLLKVM